jgi:hypothetical protein
MPDLAFPLHDPDIKHHERIHSGMKRYPSRHRRVDIMNALQEHPSLHVTLIPQTLRGDLLSPA